MIIGRTSTECGALCFFPISEDEYHQLQDIQGNDSYYVTKKPLTDNLLCTIYYSRDDELNTLLYFGENTTETNLSYIQKHNLQLIGSFVLTPTYPILRICDAREAYYVPKSCTSSQFQYVLTKKQLPQLDYEAFQPWELCESLHQIPPSFSFEFWTGLDPKPIIEACEQENISGWFKLPNGHWTLPPSTSPKDMQTIYQQFQQIKQQNQFKCGFDMKCTHLIYDNIHRLIEESSSEGSIYPSNTGDGIAVYSSNDVYLIETLEANITEINTQEVKTKKRKKYIHEINTNTLQSLIVRSLTDEERNSHFF